MPLTKVQQSPLQKFADSIKSTDKAKRNPATALLQIIEDYEKTGEFSAYVIAHRADIAKYLAPGNKRPGRWRASAAGKCMQEQAFEVVARLWSEKGAPEQYKQVVTDTERRFDSTPATHERTPENARALMNGTFTHVRWHLFFDALAQKGLVKTITAEEMRYHEIAQVSGTVDRVIEFAYGDETVRAVIDYKSMKSSYFNPLLEPTADNTKQQMAYQLYGYNAGWWMMLYECKDTHKLKCYARRYDEIAVGALHEQYRKLNNWVDLVMAGAINDQLPKLPLITDWCRYCFWNRTCKIINPDRDGAQRG